jgi:hypothetical protein
MIIRILVAYRFSYPASYPSQTRKIDQGTVVDMSKTASKTRSLCSLSLTDISTIGPSDFF